MRTPIEALKEIRDRLTYFCLRTDGKYDPPWATELVGIIDESVTDNHAVGNAAAMREVLVALQARFEKNTMAYQDRYFKFTGWHWRKKAEEAKKWRDIFSELNDQCKAALTVPPRNCDVGTEQEQHRRFLTFCNAHIDCVDCPIKAYWTKALSCGILWGQMSYEAKPEKKGE